MQHNNLEILKNKQIMFDKNQGVRVGDFLKLRDGRYLRVSQNWDKDIQTSSGGSFYFGKGFCGFTDEVYQAIDKGYIHQADEIKKGSIWFFNNNEAQAHNGVYVEAEFRVFEFKNIEDELSYLAEAHSIIMQFANMRVWINRS